MPSCHFSRVYSGTSWMDLKAYKQIQMAKNCKELVYSILVKVKINQHQFDEICDDLSYPNTCYQEYAHKSVAGSDGEWKCIIIESVQTKQQIIIYTAGRPYPLYASICDTIT